jgi:hypothetical protein
MIEKTLKHARRLVLLISLLLSACVTSTTTEVRTSTTTEVRGQTKEPRGFFDRVTDAITERECNVLRFTCPYGFGPAGEPCECTDPKGVVLKGHTIK